MQNEPNIKYSTQFPAIRKYQQIGPIDMVVTDTKKDRRSSDFSNKLWTRLG